MKCKGMNCSSTDGRNHSPECIAEHAAAVAGGRFVKDLTPSAPTAPCYQCGGCGDNDAAPGHCVRCGGSGVELAVPAQEQLRKAVRAVVSMLKDGEYAEHWANAEAPGDADATALEDAITELVSEANEVAPAQGEPVAWLHEIMEPNGHQARMLSDRPSNPWSHWMESHRKKCAYKATPLYTAPQPAPAVAKEGMTERQRDILIRLHNVLDTGKAHSGIAHDDAATYAEALRALLGAKGEL